VVEDYYFCCLLLLIVANACKLLTLLWEG